MYNHILSSQHPETGGKNEFVNKEYAVPSELLTGKTEVRVKFKAKSGYIFGGIYYVRLLQSEKDATAIKSVNFNVPRTDHRIYTLDGRQVTGTFESLSRGIYVVNYKKYIKK